MRTFIAIELPKETKDFLSVLQEQLKKSGADVKWVEPQNIHLTLKFLGEIDGRKLEEVKQILEDITRDKNSFSIRLSSLGAFPKIDFPRVIWIGIDKGNSQTQEIAKELEEKIAKVGIPKEDKPFSSHITIGRTRSILNRQKLVENLKTSVGQSVDTSGKLEFTVTKITLFESTLTSKGPIYGVLKQVNLKTI